MTKDTEPRLMGALPFIVRSSRKSDVLVIPDGAKPEMSALTPLHWWTGNEEGRAIGFPGGGRQIKDNGLPETLYQTLIRELQEELEQNIRSLPIKQNARLLPHPFVVGQAPELEEGDNPILHQIAVASVYMRYQDFSSTARMEIDTAVGEGKAFWMQMERLFQIAKLDHPESSSFGTLPFRPQVLTSALLWYFGLVERESKEQLTERIRVGNQAIISKLSTEAERMGRTVKNGTVTHDGRIAEDLLSADKRFLLGKPITRK